MDVGVPGTESGVGLDRRGSGIKCSSIRTDVVFMDGKTSCFPGENTLTNSSSSDASVFMLNFGGIKIRSCPGEFTSANPSCSDASASMLNLGRIKLRVISMLASAELSLIRLYRVG